MNIPVCLTFPGLHGFRQRVKIFIVSTERNSNKKTPLGTLAIEQVSLAVCLQVWCEWIVVKSKIILEVTTNGKVHYRRKNRTEV